MIEPGVYGGGGTMSVGMFDVRRDGCLTDERLGDAAWLAAHLPDLGDDWLVRTLVGRMEDAGRFAEAIDAVGAELGRRYYGAEEDGP